MINIVQRAAGPRAELHAVPSPNGRERGLRGRVPRLLQAGRRLYPPRRGPALRRYR